MMEESIFFLIFLFLTICEKKVSDKTLNGNKITEFMGNEEEKKYWKECLENKSL